MIHGYVSNSVKQSIKTQLATYQSNHPTTSSPRYDPDSLKLLNEASEMRAKSRSVPIRQCVMNSVVFESSSSVSDISITFAVIFEGLAFFAESLGFREERLDGMRTVKIKQSRSDDYPLSLEEALTCGR
jgi:hypothetical protein